MSEDVIKIVLHTDGAQSEATMHRATATNNDYAASLGKTKRAALDSGDELKRMAAATDKATASKGRGATALLAFQKAADAAKEGTFGLGKTIANVAFAFGPWGMAIGVVSQALIGLVESDREATEAAKKHTEALKEQRRAAEAVRTALVDARLASHAHKIGIQQATESHREEIHAYDLQIAISAKAGVSTKKLAAERIGALAREQDAIAEVFDLEAERARRRGDLEAQFKAEDEAATARDNAAAHRREKEIADIEAGTEAVKRNTAAKRDNVAVDEARTRAMQMSMLGPNVRGSAASFNEAQQFGAGLNEARFDATAQMDRGGERAGSEEAFRIEIDRMQEVEEIRENSSLAQRERHEEEMRQLAEKQAAYQAHAATATGVAMSLMSITEARRSAIDAAKAQGKTDKQAAREGKIAALEQTAAALKSLRDVAIMKAIEQTALALGAAATFNYPSMGLHLAAAATWGVVAAGVGIGSRAVASTASGMRSADTGAANTGGGYGGGGTAGGGASGGGGTGMRSGDMPGAGSPVPGSGPSMPTGSGGGGGPHRTVVYQIANVHTYGTPEREFLRRVDEGIETEVRPNRRARTGSRRDD